MVKTKMDQKTREIFLEGLKRYQRRGVRILLDGEEVDESRWGELFEVGEDGSFYMGDYILEDQLPSEQLPELPSAAQGGGGQLQQEYGSALVQEAPAVYGRRLREIRFDRVYNR